MRRAPVDPTTTLADSVTMEALDRRQHDRAHRIGGELRLRHDRPGRGARRARRVDEASGCMSMVVSAVSSCRGASSSATTSRRSTSASTASRRSPPTPTSTASASRARRCVHVPRPCAAQQPVLLHDRLERREVLLPRHRRIAVERPAGVDVGRHGRDRTRGLPRVRAADLRDVGRHAGRRAIPCRAPAARPAHVPVRVHVGRARHLPRERLAPVERMADERPAVSRRHPHGRDPTADAARASSRRGSTTSPPQWRTPRRSTARRRRAVRSTAASPAGRRPRPTSSSTP